MSTVVSMVSIRLVLLSDVRIAVTPTVTNTSDKTIGTAAVYVGKKRN
jgi:hypothetical protein